MENKKLSFIEKYSYGLGAIGKDMACGIIFTYCMIYFTDVLGLAASFVGTLFFFAKFWDAINDLGMGMIVDNTRSRWGKFRPWLVIGTLLNSVVLIVMFTNWGLSGTPLYIFASVMYVLWGMTYTIMDIPYWSMLPNLTNDPVERDKIAIIPRIFAAIGGSLLISGFGLQIMNFLGKGDVQAGYTNFAWLIVIVFIVTIGITCLNVKSADCVNETAKAEKISFKDIWHVIRNNDQLLVAIIVILTWNFAGQCIGSVQLYYFKYVVGNEGMFSMFAMFGAFACMGGLMLFPIISKKLNKKQTYFVAIAIAMAGLFMLWAVGYFAPENPILTAISGILWQLGGGIQTGIVTVVLADVVDYGEYKLGTRNESVIFSLQTLLVKFTSAIGTLFTGFALDLTGYIPNSETQADSTLLGMRILMIALPLIIVVVSYVLYKRLYKLDRAYIQRIMNILSLRRTGQVASEDVIEGEEVDTLAFDEEEEYVNTIS